VISVEAVIQHYEWPGCAVLFTHWGKLISRPSKTVFLNISYILSRIKKSKVEHMTKRIFI
jgi:hypothetical protein